MSGRTGKWKGRQGQIPEQQQQQENSRETTATATAPQRHSCSGKMFVHTREGTKENGKAQWTGHCLFNSFWSTIHLNPSSPASLPFQLISCLRVFFRLSSLRLRSDRDGTRVGRELPPSTRTSPSASAVEKEEEEEEDPV